MKRQDIEMTSKHRMDISMRVCMLILGVCLVSYLFKIFGSEIFNKFITNEYFVKASTIIDNTYWLNILCYGILGYVITQFTFCMTCGKLKLKWFEYIIIFMFSIGMAIIRNKWISEITYLFDALQYLILPTIYGTITRKTNIINNIMNCLIMYFINCGIMTYNLTLCNLKALMYASNFIAYILCFIEIYLLIISFSIFIINGGNKNGKSNVFIKQEKRPNARV